MSRFLFLLLTAFAYTSVASAQSREEVKPVNDRFSFKVQTIMGAYMDPSSNLLDIDPNSPTGLNFGIELPSTRQRPWQQYLNDPTVGLGISYLNFGNKTMGEGIAMYPYLLFHVIRRERFNANIKLGAGLVAVNGHYKATLNDSIPNKTFGSMLNAYLTTGLNLDFPITRNIKVNGELGFYHISNGRISEPNKGANVLYGGVGLVATFNPCEGSERKPLNFPDLPYKWSLNVIGAAGAHNADLDDAHKYFVSTFHVGAVVTRNNWYGTGVGLDVFYNDGIGSESARGLYCPDHEYNNYLKTKAGISWNNEFRFGDVTALLHWGVYVFNPVRNYYADDHKILHTWKLPLIYLTNGAGSQEACHYIRFGVRYRIWDNMYLQALAKTHLHICEYIEFGLGYQIPFIRKSERKADGGNIFHHRKGWWE